MKLVNIHTLLVFLSISMVGNQSVIAQEWSLQQCLDTAQVHNKRLLMSRNTQSMTEEKSKEAKANLIPKLTVNADYKYFTNLPYQLLPLSVFGGPEGKFKETQFGVPHNINANIQLSMPLYNPQVYGAIQATKIATELSDLQYQKTEEQVYFEISNMYYNAQILYHQMAFIDSNLINADKLLKNMQLLKDQLLVKGTDVNKVKLQVSQLNTMKENVNSKYQQVLNALKFTMGIPQEQPIQVNSTILYKNNLEYTSTTTLDLRLSNAQNKLISSELSTLRYSRLPSLALIGSYGTMGYGYDKKPNDFLNFYPVGFAGVQFSYPLFNGTVTMRKINQKKFEFQNSEIQSEMLTEQNIMQIDNARLQKTVSEKSVETTTEQIQLAQSIYEQTIIQQKQGTANLTDVLLADNALREAQQAYLSAVIDYLKADLELKKITGNISSSN